MQGVPLLEFQHGQGVAISMLAEKVTEGQLIEVLACRARDLGPEA
jgi:hypothetical protein